MNGCSQRADGNWLQALHFATIPDWVNGENINGLLGTPFAEVAGSLFQ